LHAAVSLSRPPCLNSTRNAG